MSHSFLSIENLSKRYPGKNKSEELEVFNDVNIDIEKGEFVCITGHSGCGKSTILNVLAGFEEPTEGAVIMDGKEINGSSLDRGVVFQNYSLMPWLTALGNVSFGVRARWPTWSKKKIEEHSLNYLNMVGLSSATHQKPSQLSGGMRQRVSIARAFATHPKLLLLDEPFGALDALTRGIIQDELIKIWGETKQTVFMITHDVDEAILLADRILLMSNGPSAYVAESVKVNIPRPRERAKVIEHPGYYKIRNYLVNFLVSRSGNLDEENRANCPVFVDPTQTHPENTTIANKASNETTDDAQAGKRFRIAN